MFLIDGRDREDGQHLSDDYSEGVFGEKFSGTNSREDAYQHTNSEVRKVVEVGRTAARIQMQCGRGQSTDCSRSSRSRCNVQASTFLARDTGLGHSSAHYSIIQKVDNVSRLHGQCVG